MRSWVPVRARDIEIARRPDPSARHHRASGDLEHESGSAPPGAPMPGVGRSGFGPADSD
ncbi:hypothetical protein ACFXP3_22475 [Streptomyces sp. NPDC059096]|uniref:hypothetical protein n=1 Tax=Streptomyces sp. NPDC059096 TaxID=3346727 RepID=UPI003697DCC7